MNAAILAGGQARRFGGLDKSALVVGNSSILERQVSVLREVADRVLLVGGNHVSLEDRALEVVPDRLPHAGALGGIYTALLASHTEHVIVLACDLPFVSANFLRHLAGLAGPGLDAVVPRSPDGLQPLCAVYSRSLAPRIGELIAAGRLKVAGALEAGRVREIDPAEIAAVEPDEKLFLNVNTPDDLERASRLLHNSTR